MPHDVADGAVPARRRPRALRVGSSPTAHRPSRWPTARWRRPGSTSPQKSRPPTRDVLKMPSADSCSAACSPGSRSRSEAGHSPMIAHGCWRRSTSLRATRSAPTGSRAWSTRRGTLGDDAAEERALAATFSRQRGWPRADARLHHRAPSQVEGDGSAARSRCLTVGRADRSLPVYGDVALNQYFDLVERLAALPGKKAIVLMRPGLRLEHDNVGTAAGPRQLCRTSRGSVSTPSIRADSTRRRRSTSASFRS